MSCSMAALLPKLLPISNFTGDRVVKSGGPTVCLRTIEGCSSIGHLPDGWSVACTSCHITLRNARCSFDSMMFLSRGRPGGGRPGGVRGAGVPGAS